MSSRNLHLRLAGAALLALALALLGDQVGAATAAASAASAAAPAVVAVAAPAPVDTGPSLRQDPFRRPQIGPNGVVVVRNPAEEREGAPAVIEPPPWQPDLRGVMLAGADSIANVDGTILRIGEAIDGWRLLRVDDGRATFAKAGRQTTLSMNNAGQARR